MRFLPADNMKILIIGPVGSGKSTQASLLSGYLKIPVISMSTLLREVAEQSGEQGEKIKQIMGSGGLVDDQTVSGLVKSKTDSLGGSGFLLDGYPRTLKQIELFDPKFDLVIYLDISDDQIMDRLLQRGREDDKPEVILNRLNYYRDYTQPILDYYKMLGILKPVDASRLIEEIAENVRRIVDEQGIK